MASSKALTHRAQPGALTSVRTTAQIFEAFPDQLYNVLAPITHMAALPAGTRLALTEVRVDVQADTFPLPGGARLIGKPKLDQIANGGGISWLEEKRVDNARSPHYVEMFVRGRITDFDGTVREITGTKTIDLREDAGDGIPGKDYDEIVSKAKAKKRDYRSQLMEARKFIAEIAASKARNRAIASALGIKRSYTPQELQRPFIIPKLVPDTQDPDAKRMVQATMAGAAGLLFGGQAVQSSVIDQAFDQPTQTFPGEAGEEVDEVPAHQQASSTSNTEPEATGTREVLDIVLGAWAKASEAGMAADGFRKLCESNTGKASKDAMTLVDAQAVARAVEAYVATSGDDQGCPV
jgi:hypothetical protein